MYIIPAMMKVMMHFKLALNKLKQILLSTSKVPQSKSALIQVQQQTLLTMQRMKQSMLLKHCH